MAVSPPVDRASSPSLFNSLRSFVGVLLATLCTRFDLATLELEEQALFAAHLVLCGLVALICAASAFFFLMLLIVAIFWDEKVLVLSIILGVYVVGGAVFALAARSLFHNRPKLLEQTLIELRKDVDGLRRPILTSEHDS